MMTAELSRPAAGTAQSGRTLTPATADNDSVTITGIATGHDPADFSSLTEYVTATVKDAILSHALPPLTRLREESLAKELGVSRLPVREAFKVLSAQGLVNLRPHGRGAAVAELTREMLRQVYQIRAALEILSVGLAAKCMSDTELDHLDEVVKEGIDAVDNRDWRNAAVLGSEFHRIIASGSGNDHLAELIERFDEKLRWANEPVSSDRGSELWQEHHAIAEALRKRDQETAEKLMQEHTTKSGTSLSSSFKENDVRPAGADGLSRCV